MSLSISVVVPLYNHERYIASTLFSVFQQTHASREVIVIDDGSADSGAEIVRGLHKTRPELVFWRQSNRGAHNTINTGIARATGDLVAILNSDDIFEPERFAIAAQAFAEDATLDVVATGLSFIDSEGAPIPNAWYDQAMRYYEESGRDLGVTLVNGNIFMTTSNLIVRRRVFDEIGMFSNLRYAHDLDFCLRLVSEQRKVRIIEQPLLRYRIHPTNTIAEGVLKVKAEWAMVTAFYLARVLQRGAAWSEVFRYLPVLRAHTLTEPVFLLLGYFMQHPSLTLERNAIHSDGEFQARLRESLA